MENIVFKNESVLKDKLPNSLFSSLKDECFGNKNNKDVFVSGLTSESVAKVAKHYYLKDNFNLLDSYLNKFVGEYLKTNNRYLSLPILTKDAPLKLTKVWINYQRENEFIPNHLHDGLFSFVIWINLPNKSSFEFLYTDILGQIQSIEYKLTKDDEGTILFFPSKLRHQVYPFYDTNDVRITISGNILFNINESEV